MNEPRVVCTMLTKGRPEFAQRALRCWQQQTYRNRELLIIDDAAEPSFSRYSWEDRRISYRRADSPRAFGALRNLAASCCDHARLILHWDDDEISHPERITRQVEFHLESGAKVTGFHSLPFWNSETGEIHEYKGKPIFAMGSSLCYSPETWRRKQFGLISTPDETFVCEHHTIGSDYWFSGVPLLVSEIHKRNTSPKQVSKKPFRAAPELRDSVSQLQKLIGLEVAA